jgi:hypothetical protein
LAANEMAAETRVHFSAPLTAQGACSLPYSQNAAEYARWRAGEVSRRYRPTWFEPDTAMFLAIALQGHVSRLDRKEAKALNFTVTAIDDLGASRVIAAAANVEVA